MPDRRWSGARMAPAVRRTACRDCGEPIETFRTDYGRPVALEVTRPPITADLAAPRYRHRVWEYRGRRIGWCLKAFPPIRSWRELRAEHACAPETQSQQQNQREHEKENRP